MAKTIFEELGGKYERQGDYLIPCIALPAEKERPIGIWGQRHLEPKIPYQLYICQPMLIPKSSIISF